MIFGDDYCIGSQRLCVICNPEYDGVLVSTRMEYVAGPISLKTVESIAFPADEEVQFPDDNETGEKDEDSILTLCLYIFKTVTTDIMFVHT